MTDYKQLFDETMEVVGDRLNSNGWSANIREYKDPERYNLTSSNEYLLKEFQTACEFLDLLGKPRKTLDKNMSSYGMKHAAEKWGKENGKAPYICNGIMILAIIAKGFAPHPLWDTTGSLNVYSRASWTNYKKLYGINEE